MTDQVAEELIGTVSKFIFSNTETGYRVLVLDLAKGGSQVVTGVFPAIAEGEYVRLMGSYSFHKTHGRQFRADRKVPHNTEEGIIKYLASRQITGIGLKTAQKIVGQFGLKTLEIMDRVPNRLTEVPSIGKKKIRAILDDWEVHRTDRMVELFLLSNQLSPRLAQTIIKTYGKSTLNVLCQNPYRLASDIRGIGFLSADTFAKSMGIPQDSKERLMAATVYALRKAEEQGHCFLYYNELLTDLCEIAQVDQQILADRLPDCIMTLVRQSTVVAEPIQETTAMAATNAIYLRELYEAEQVVASKLKQMLQIKLTTDMFRLEAWIDHYSKTQKIKLSGQQIEAVRAAVSHRVFVLTGGPGVGKSTTANTIIKLLKELGKDVALAAPTGRAAQRLAEITGESAKTIHRLLEWNPEAGRFKRDPLNPLSAGSVVIDETSMLDLRLARSLLEALNTNSQIIFIGDFDQLPSVGAGNFLGDLINSNAIPYVKLSEVFRQAAQSDIISYAHAINKGISPQFSNLKESDCRFIQVDQPEHTAGAILKLLSEILPNKTSYDPVKDVQVLTPMKKSLLGTDALNRDIQELLNHRDESREFNSEGESLRRNDKVIQMVNNYDLNVFNGDIGYVVDAGVQGGQVLVQFGDRTVSYAFEQARDLKLAYAITIHKSQGSEFPVVIIPLTTQHYVMLQRNLIYTALTRAKKLAIFVGTERALKQAIRTETSKTRKTSLAAILQEPKSHA